MEIERLEQILEETKSNWKGDNAFKGLQILAKYTDEPIGAAEHDIIYSANVDEVLDCITEEDAIQLAKLNWMIDSEGECFACFV